MESVELTVATLVAGRFFSEFCSYEIATVGKSDGGTNDRKNAEDASNAAGARSPGASIELSGAEFEFAGTGTEIGAAFVGSLADIRSLVTRSVWTATGVDVVVTTLGTFEITVLVILDAENRRRRFPRASASVSVSDSPAVTPTGATDS